MVEAINACRLSQEANSAIRQILMRERSEKNVLGVNDLETLEQYDKIIDEAVNKGGN